LIDTVELPPGSDVTQWMVIAGWTPPPVRPRIGRPGLRLPTFENDAVVAGKVVMAVAVAGALTYTTWSLVPAELAFTQVKRIVHEYCSDVVFVSQLPGTVVPSEAKKSVLELTVVIVPLVQVVLTVESKLPPVACA